MADKQTTGTGARRGKQKRKPHWIYEIEKALELDHSDIARLLTPEPLTIRAVRDICKTQSNTAALAGLKFSVPQATVSDIIAGESEAWSQVAEKRLSQRLGLIVAIYHETGDTLWGYDETIFSKDSLRRYLDLADKMMKPPYGVGFAGFAEPTNLAKPAGRRPRYTVPPPKSRRKRGAAIDE